MAFGKRLRIESRFLKVIFLIFAATDLWFLKYSALQVQQKDKVVNKEIMERPFQREDFQDSQSALQAQQEDKVFNKGSMESKPICMIQVRNACEEHPELPYLGWFSDDEKGGPVASSVEECSARMRSWKETCHDGDVDVFYDPSWDGKETSSIPEILDILFQKRKEGNLS